jgi:hypothetical protein
LSTGTLAAIARQRAVLSTIADVIVAVAHGKSLRVAIHCDSWDDNAFADRLTQALLARGRNCRCAPTTHGFAPTADHTASEGPAGARSIALIISGPADPDDTDLCHISVQVYAVVRPPVPSAVEGGLDLDERDRGGYPYNRESDIVVDYLAPDGPVIRHLASWLAPVAPK